MKKDIVLAEPPPIDPNRTLSVGLSAGDFNYNEEQQKVRFTPPVPDPDQAVRNTDEVDPAGQAPVIQRLIRTGAVEIESEVLTDSKNYLDRQLSSIEGYYEDEGFENDNSQTVYNLKARIPAEAFDRFLKSLEGTGGTIRSRNVQVTNVTAEYVDVESRLATKRTYMLRYKELVQKAGKVSDLLAIEENIRTLQEEIESSEGQMRVLKNQIGYSTLDIKLFKNKEYVMEGDSFWVQLHHAFRQSSENVQALLLWIVENWAILLGILFGGWLLRRRWLGRRR